MDKNTAQEIAEDLITDPDAAAGTGKLPPQTTNAEPTSDRPGQPRIPDDED